MQQVNEEYFTVEDVAKRLKVDPRTVRRWIEDGRLGVVKFAPGRGAVRITDSDLKAFVSRHRTPPREHERED